MILLVANVSRETLIYLFIKLYFYIYLRITNVSCETFVSVFLCENISIYFL